MIFHGIFIGCLFGEYHFTSSLLLFGGTTTINQAGFMNPGLTLAQLHGIFMGSFIRFSWIKAFDGILWDTKVVSWDFQMSYTGDDLSIQVTLMCLYMFRLCFVVIHRDLTIKS